MQSKHAFILVLMAGAAGLVIALSGFLTLAMLESASPYLGIRETKDAKASVNAPRLLTKVEGNTVQIVEIDDSGLVVRILHTSELADRVADFSLFAVPQTTYNGLAYVQSNQDAKLGSLIIYPMKVETGQLSAAVINVPSSAATVSLDQSRVAVLNLNQSPHVAAYDIATGALLATWSLSSGERLTEKAYTRTYTGSGANWVSGECFDHPVWDSAGDMETRLFCIQGE